MKNYIAKIRRGKKRFRPGNKVKHDNGGFREQKSKTLDRLLKPGMRIEP